MQRKTPLTPQSRRLNRTMARTTMAPADFSTTVAGPAGNRRLALSRHSIMPAMQSQQETGKKLETENKDLELRRLYDKYLQSEMMVLLAKRKAAEKEKMIVSQLATLMKEEDAVKKELLSVKMKERDLKNLIVLQNSLDEQHTEIDACLADFDNKPMEILKQLQAMLESLDVLKCENIKIPETRDGMEKIHQQLEKCGSLLMSINETIGAKRDALINVNKGLKDFNKTYADIQDCSKKCGETLEQLQILVLKEGANSLTLARRGERSAFIE